MLLASLAALGPLGKGSGTVRLAPSLVPKLSFDRNRWIPVCVVYSHQKVGMGTST